MSLTFQELIQRRAFGVARTLGGDEFTITPSWFAVDKDGDDLPDLDALIAAEAESETEGKTLPSLDRLFEREGGGLALQVRAGETAGEKGGRYTDFIASTADVDRMGDIVDQTTWRLAAWRSNPVILHEHGGGFFSAPSIHSGGVVGRGTAKINREAGRLEIRTYWDEADVNPLGQLMAHQHANGFRRAMSVGFLPGKAISRASDDLKDDDPRKAPKGTPRWKAGHIFSHNELLESSTVGVPANRAAVQLASFAQGIEDPDLATRSFVSESMAKSAAANVLEALKDPTVRRAIEALIWASHEPPATKSTLTGLPGDLSRLFG